MFFRLIATFFFCWVLGVFPSSAQPNARVIRHIDFGEVHPGEAVSLSPFDGSHCLSERPDTMCALIEYTVTAEESTEPDSFYPDVTAGFLYDKGQTIQWEPIVGCVTQTASGLRVTPPPCQLEANKPTWVAVGGTVRMSKRKRRGKYSGKSRLTVQKASVSIDAQVQIKDTAQSCELTIGRGGQSIYLGAYDRKTVSGRTIMINPMSCTSNFTHGRERGHAPRCAEIHLQPQTPDHGSVTQYTRTESVRLNSTSGDYVIFEPKEYCIPSGCKDAGPYSRLTIHIGGNVEIPMITLSDLYQGSVTYTFTCVEM